ncbi:hypothetical protein D3X11_04155 [Streptococcus sp. X16XC17]|uniref:hypothetical protein n=1 Tax=unclassified Streptococcus TaxID=2608887 RepID=UPI00066FFE54|nr:MULTISPECIES: hypothetical protein [unclassified Streptococcus]TCD46587.1 hypothetical protein D3X11_04155 [Streptococcus sp. X16XC17]
MYEKKHILKGLLFSTMAMASVAAAQVHADDHLAQGSYYTYTNVEGYQATSHFLNQKQAIIEDVKKHISSLGDVVTPLREKIMEVNRLILSYEHEDHKLVHQLNYGNNTDAQYYSAVQKRDELLQNIFELIESDKAELEYIRESYYSLSQERSTLINQIFSILSHPSSRRIYSYRDAERENLIRSLQQYMDRLLVVQSELNALIDKANSLTTDDLSAEIGKLSGILFELTDESATVKEEENTPSIPQAVEEEETPVTLEPAKEEETSVAPKPTPSPDNTKPAISVTANYNIINDALNLGNIDDYTALTNGLTHAIDNKVGTIRYKLVFNSREQVNAYAAQLSKLLDQYADSAGTILRIRTSNQLGTYYRGNSVSHIEVETTLQIDYTLEGHQKALVAEYKDFIKQVVKEQITDKNITDDYEKAKILNQYIIDSYEYADRELSTNSLRHQCSCSRVVV